MRLERAQASTCAKPEWSSGARLVAHACLLLAAACGGRSVSTKEGPATPTPSSCRFQLEWEIEFSGDRAYSLEWMVPARAGYVLSGRRFVEGRESGVVLAIDERGALLWERHLDQQASVLAAWGDNFVVAGSRRVTGRESEVVISLFDERGDLRWEAVAGTEDDDYARALVVEGDELGIVGTSMPTTSDQPNAFASLVDATGRVRFARAYGEVSHELRRSRDEHAFGGMFDATGQLVVAAQRWLDGGHGPLWIFALDAAGGVAWERVDELESFRSGQWSTTRTRDRGLVIVGALPEEQGGNAGATRLVYLNERADVAWTTLLDQSAARQAIAELFELDAGGFVGVGRSSESDAPGARLLHFDAAGSLTSVRRIEEEGVGHDDLERLRPSPSGGFWLAGSEWGGDVEPDSLRVVRADSQGLVLWRHESQGVGVGMVHALDVNASGRAVVAGTFFDEAHQSRVMMVAEACAGEPG